MRYAVIREGLVVNVILWDGSAPLVLPAGQASSLGMPVGERAACEAGPRVNLLAFGESPADSTRSRPR